MRRVPKKPLVLPNFKLETPENKCASFGLFVAALRTSPFNWSATFLRRDFAGGLHNSYIDFNPLITWGDTSVASWIVSTNEQLPRVALAFRARGRDHFWRLLIDKNFVKQEQVAEMEMAVPDDDKEHVYYWDIAERPLGRLVYGIEPKRNSRYYRIGIEMNNDPRMNAHDFAAAFIELYGTISDTLRTVCGESDLMTSQGFARYQ